MLKRYGHCSLYLNGYLYCMGGFAHKDLPNEAPVTLGSCEKFSIIDNQWTTIGTMNESRAFFASVSIENQFIFVFGGLHDFNILQTIEKYDILADNWVSMFFKLPMPLAKLGAVAIENQNGVLICGGMTEPEFEAIADTYFLDIS